MLFLMKRKNGYLCRHAHTEWNHTAEAIGNIKATIGNSIESTIFLIFKYYWGEAKERQLSTMCMTTQGQLDMTVRQDFPMPGRGIVLQKDNEILTADTIKSR